MLRKHWRYLVINVSIHSNFQSSNSIGSNEIISYVKMIIVLIYCNPIISSTTPLLRKTGRSFLLAVSTGQTMRNILSLKYDKF